MTAKSRPAGHTPKLLRLIKEIKSSQTPDGKCDCRLCSYHKMECVTAIRKARGERRYGKEKDREIYPTI